MYLVKPKTWDQYTASVGNNSHRYKFPKYSDFDLDEATDIDAIRRKAESDPLVVSNGFYTIVLRHEPQEYRKPNITVAYYTEPGFKGIKLPLGFQEFLFKGAISGVGQDISYYYRLSMHYLDGDVWKVYARCTDYRNFVKP